MRLINIGFGNMISVDRIVAVVNPDSAPVKRLIQEARDDKRILDATQGRRTRAVILMSSATKSCSRPSSRKPSQAARQAGNTTRTRRRRQD